jgi:hypothetical protein
MWSRSWNLVSIWTLEFTGKIIGDGEKKYLYIGGSNSSLRSPRKVMLTLFLVSRISILEIVFGCNLITSFHRHCAERGS